MSIEFDMSKETRSFFVGMLLSSCVWAVIAWQMTANAYRIGLEEGVEGGMKNPSNVYMPRSKPLEKTVPYGKIMLKPGE